MCTRTSSQVLQHAISIVIHSISFMFCCSSASLSAAENHQNHNCRVAVYFRGLFNMVFVRQVKTTLYLLSIWFCVWLSGEPMLHPSSYWSLQPSNLGAPSQQHLNLKHEMHLLVVSMFGRSIQMNNHLLFPDSQAAR